MWVSISTLVPALQNVKELGLLQKIALRGQQYHQPQLKDGESET